MMVLLLACAVTPEAVSEEAAFTPVFGDWQAEFSPTWEGDCRLADAHTYESADQQWTLTAYRDGFSIVDEEGYWVDCSLDEEQFTCDLPGIADDFSSLGYDIAAVYTRTWQGAFTEETRLSGAYTVAAECTGADCDLMTGYGEDFVFPCTAEAALTAEAR